MFWYFVHVCNFFSRWIQWWHILISGSSDDIFPLNLLDWTGPMNFFNLFNEFVRLVEWILIGGRMRKSQWENVKDSLWCYKIWKTWDKWEKWEKWKKWETSEINPSTSQLWVWKNKSTIEWLLLQTLRSTLRSYSSRE